MNPIATIRNNKITPYVNRFIGMAFAINFAAAILATLLFTSPFTALFGLIVLLVGWYATAFLLFLSVADLSKAIQNGEL